MDKKSLPASLEKIAKLTDVFSQGTGQMPDMQEVMSAAENMLSGQKDSTADKPSETIITVKLRYSLLDSDGNEEEAGEGEGHLSEENLAVMPNLGMPLKYPLRSFSVSSTDDYRLELQCVSGETLILYHMGYKFDDFVRILVRLKNQTLLSDMLFLESLRTSGIQANFSLTNNSGQQTRGECEVRLYDTALVTLTAASEVFRLPYSFIDDVKVEDYVMTIVSELGSVLQLSHLGPKLDLLSRRLSEAMNDLALQAQTMVQEFTPDASPRVIRQAARLLRDGRAVRQESLGEVCPELWPQLEQQLDIVGIKEEYEFLSRLSPPGKTAIGVKKGLMGDITGDYTWFLIPLYSANPQQAGNAVAMEASSEGEGGGKATYFFRITGRNQYRELNDIDQLHYVARDFMSLLNICLLAINFRRQPIYITDEQLNTPRFARYRYSVALIPELQLLRERFIGRVFHRSKEQWEQDVADLLDFNVSSTDDSERWSKT